MFPTFRDSGPFLNLLPFPTGGGSAVTVSPGTPTVVGTDITFPSTSDRSLVGAVYGVEFGIGVGAGYVWSENVAGAASSQTITIDIATYGGTTSSTVNARTYYNLDPLDDPATRVYSAMLVPLVNSASINDTTPTVGDTLTGSAGIIVGGYPMTLTQAWQQCDSGGPNCSAIGGATATTYLVVSGDIGSTLKYQQTSTNSAGAGSATSAATSAVASAGYQLISHVEAGSTNTGTSVTTGAINTTGANAIKVAVVTLDSATGWTITDNKGNGNATLVKSRTYAGAGTTVSIYHWENPTVGTGHTFSVNIGTGKPYPAISVAAFSGGALSGSADQNNSAQASGATSLATGSITPTENNELIVAALGLASTNTDTVSVNNSMTIYQQPGSSGNCFHCSFAWKTQTTAAAINPTFSWATSDFPNACIASFKAA